MAPWLHGMRSQYGLTSAVPNLKSGRQPSFGKDEAHRPAPQFVAPKRPSRPQGWRRAKTGSAPLSQNWDAALKPSMLRKRAAEQAKEIEAIAKSGSVEIERDANSKASKKDFINQGDAALNTHEVVRQRLALRHAPAVLAVMLAWWETALRSDGIDDPEGRAHLGKGGHIRCLTMLVRALQHSKLRPLPCPTLRLLW